MLKNIRLHVEKDEERQAELEQQLAAHIAKTSQENFNSFQRYIPSLTGYFHQQSQNISIFCNKYGRYNIVDYGVGRTLYGFDPEQECLQHVQAFCQKASYFDFSADREEEHKSTPPLSESVTLESLPAYQAYLNRTPLPSVPELVVVFGLGLGVHIRYLVEHFKIKHIIIYEPDVQYFRCSVMVTHWKTILELAKQKNTAIYFQIGKDGRDLLEDFAELKQHVQVPGAYFYQHYNHPVFNSIVNQLQKKSWLELSERGMNFQLVENVDEYCPPWTPTLTLQDWQDVSPDDSLYKSNLAAFSKYFPDIYKEFSDYCPKIWLPVSSVDGQINLVQKQRLVCWYGDQPLDEGLANFAGFAEFPHKDGLVLGYSGTKLKHYLHYKFVAKTEEILKKLDEEQGSLPETIKSVILFGLGCGYQLQALMNEHNVNNLFICEPNRDFFYASLFAIDWAGILNKIDKSRGRLYINIGDDGSNLFKDLLRQFYVIGPYILNSTYFYQSYYNGILNQAIAQLREQLKVVISMGEYFDHAYYGIAHTREALKREYPFLKKKSGFAQQIVHQTVPVFLVGNGPSLDFSIETIKEHQDKAIIVSCGTSLQVLHRNGIVPDFHAEIEQNRSTFDWACRIGDFEYLKKITLISCNGVHPDTCDLYKDVFLAFKEGESSSVSTLQVLREENYQVLKFAFPTVTNFALNFFVNIGMKQVYLFGVDLGFSDKNHHHSMQSGYYKENGEEIYNYSEKSNVAIVVPGNFRRSVFTKYEFKVSRMLLEQSLAAEKIECYNCSDGAKINGAIPLRIEDVLVSSEPLDKQNCILSIKSDSFLSLKSHLFKYEYETKFSHQALLDELAVFSKLSDTEVQEMEQAEELIEHQKRLLFISYQHGRSLLFYFLYGTMNYVNSVLIKILHSACDERRCLDDFNMARRWWNSALVNICERLELKSMLLDVSASFAYHRYDLNVRLTSIGLKLTVVSNSERFVCVAKKLNESRRLGLDIDFFECDRAFSLLNGNSSELVVVYSNPSLDRHIEYSEVFSWDKKFHYVVFVNEMKPALDVCEIPNNVSLIYLPGCIDHPDGLIQGNEVFRFTIFCSYLNSFDDFRLIIPKAVVNNVKVANSHFVSIPKDTFYLYDFQDSICFSLNDPERVMMQAASGNRGDYIGRALSPSMLLLREESEESYVALKQQTLVSFPFLNKEDRLYVQ
ncbi:hypothetical protein GCM10009092_34140 [Bowmanella denitrificans]|uniref:DUF115 domain-containing protein n=1 Tax=Bowmanella denitrificans TaxID=366582 RepID=A0ABN0XL14_9ALTE